MTGLQFEIGLTLQDGVTAFCEFANKWQESISEIYYSPVFNSRFVTRSQTANLKHEDVLEAIDILQSSGISLNLCLNAAGLDESDVDLALDSFAGYFNRITTMHHLAGYISEQVSVPLTYSYTNNHRTTYDILKVPEQFDSIVVGTGYYRRRDLLELILERGFQPIVLLNNGCSDRCLGCQGNECSLDFNLHTASLSAEELYAQRSIMPYELHGYLLKFGLPLKLKLSTRESSATYLDKMLDSYVNNLNEDAIGVDSGKASQYWARLSKFTPLRNTLDFDEVRKIKSKLWFESMLGLYA